MTDNFMASCNIPRIDHVLSRGTLSAKARVSFVWEGMQDDLIDHSGLVITKVESEGRMRFGRQLSQDFVVALNRLYEEPDGSWWRTLLHDEDVFIAIRDNYLNAYFQGCSLAKITFERGVVCAYTHYKYLLRSIDGTPYVKAVSGTYQYPDAWSENHGILASGLNEIGTLKSAAKVYSRGTEREFVAKIIKGRANVLDVEIAFSVAESEEDDAATPRIDLAALETTAEGMQLVMYEAKLFHNSELRSGSAQVPVLGQIGQYEAVLAQHHEAVTAAYLEVARLITSINGLPKNRQACAQKVIASKDTFKVSPNAILIIGDFDSDQKIGKKWEVHRNKLEQHLGPTRILARKEAKDIGDVISRNAGC